LLDLFLQVEILGLLNLSKIEMVPEREKQSIMSVFGFKNLKFIIERIFFGTKVKKMHFCDQQTTLSKLASKKRMVGCLLEI